MNISKEDCSVLKDLYPYYIDNDLEKETEEWIKDHLKKCKECANWSENKENYLNEKEDINNQQINEYEKTESDLEDEKIIKRAKLILTVGIILVILIGIWQSIWIIC